MNYRKLGKTNLEISEISIGCSGYWGNQFFSEEKAISIIEQAFESGVNLFDTGHNYCQFNAEPRLGKAIKKLLCSHSRSKLIISTKAGSVVSSSPLFGKHKIPPKDFSPDYIEQSCLKSIENLHCDYLDIFQLHGTTQGEITEPLIERLMKMKQHGLFRYLGVNSHIKSDMEYIAQQADVFDLVLLDYNILQLDRETIIEKLNRAGIGVIAGTVLAQGHLIKGKIGTFTSAADIWYWLRATLKPSGRQLKRHAKKMHEILHCVEGVSAAQIAFTYILKNPHIASCVFGTTSPKNLSEILKTTNIQLNNQVCEDITRCFESIQETISA